MCKMITVFTLNACIDTPDTSWSEQNGRRFVDDIFKCITLDESYYIFIQISLTLVCEGKIDNTYSLNQTSVTPSGGIGPQ